MLIRMRIAVAGAFHNIEGGVQIGDVVDVDEVSAARYIKAKHAEAVSEPVAPVPEHALLEAETESAVVKPRRSRAKKAAPPTEWHDERAPGWKDANPDS